MKGSYGARGVTAHTIAPGPADTARLHRVGSVTRQSEVAARTAAANAT